ncbi:MAG: glutamate synthase [Acutalibacteraceae bacterium]
MVLDVTNLEFNVLNEKLRECGSTVTLKGCLGQRFIASGMKDKKITVEGIAGNALGAYLNGASITVKDNAQDAVGDTMNDGEIIIHGNIGDAAGYAMRGGKIYIKGNAGYRAGIHMKEYKDKVPVMIIGGSAGSFLGEYQAGGIIIVLGLNTGGKLVSNFPCTGMHGGKVYFRGEVSKKAFPENICLRPANEEDMKAIEKQLTEYAEIFGYDKKEILNSPFTVAVPDSNNPYKQMYVAN